MHTETYLDPVVEQTGILAEWVHAREPETPVPTAPKWTLADLVEHVGATQRMVRLLVAGRLTDPGAAFADQEPAPADPAAWRDWLNANAVAARDAFAPVADTTPVWDPSGAAAGVPLWSRRLFGEACVHRADAAAALDLAYAPRPEYAAAAVDDWLDTLTSAGYWTNRPDFAAAVRGAGQTLCFAPTDAAGGWLARRGPDGVGLERAAAPADVTLRGPAVELLLVLSRRRPLAAAEGLVVQGDRALLDHWIDHMDWVAD